MQETKAVLLLSLQGEKKQALQFDYVNQYDELSNYYAITKKILQKFKFVTSGKGNVRLNIDNFYKNSVKVSIPIFHPKNWTTIIENMLERNITIIEVTVFKMGQLRMKKQREKKVQVQFDSDGSIESVQDDIIKQAIKVNTPQRNPYKGQGVVRCTFCYYNNKSKEGSRLSGPFYGPFKGKIFAHLMCLLWPSQVYISDKGNVCGLDQAVRISKNLACSYCKQNGAFHCHNLCKKKAHFKCAIENEWLLKWSTYQAYCPDCKDGRIQAIEPRSEQNTRTLSLCQRERHISVSNLEANNQGQ